MVALAQHPGWDAPVSTAGQGIGWPGEAARLRAAELLGALHTVLSWGWPAEQGPRPLEHAISHLGEPPSQGKRRRRAREALLRHAWELRHSKDAHRAWGNLWVQGPSSSRRVASAPPDKKRGAAPGAAAVRSSSQRVGKRTGHPEPVVSF